MPMTNVNGVDLNYIDTGPVESGETIVMVHNLISSIHGFDFNIPVISKHCRVIAYDQRGHGLSSKTDSGYDSDTTSEDLFQLLQLLNVTEPFYLLGCARIGVGVIFTFFYHHPEMVKAIISVSGLWELGGVGHYAKPATEQPNLEDVAERTAANMRHLRELAKSEGMLAVFEERKRNLAMWIPKDLADPDIMSRFEEMYRQTSPTAFRSFPETITEERRQAIIAQLRNHAVPTLLIDGGEFRAGNEGRTGRVLKELCPLFQHVILPDSGHYPAIENPDDFNRALLNFIAGIRAYEWVPAARP